MIRPKPEGQLKLGMSGWPLIALIAVVGFLWTSQQFRWLTISGVKGLTVLIASGDVAVALFLGLTLLLAAAVVRKRFQFGVRALLVLTSVVAVQCDWLGTEVAAARKQHALVAEIRRARGRVRYDYMPPPGVALAAVGPPVPAWLRELLGDDFFANVAEVDLSLASPSKFELADLESLLGLAELDLGPAFGDAELERISRLTKLRRLSLDHTSVTDAGLRAIERLTQLESLSLSQTKIGDQGLMSISHLAHLQSLFLNQTAITDLGLQQLKPLRELQNLTLVSTNVSEAGLEQLKCLTKLRWLGIYGTEINDPDIVKLQLAFPDCNIR
jgi:hypothetical protein